MKAKVLKMILKGVADNVIKDQTGLSQRELDAFREEIRNDRETYDKKSHGW